jgi:hypothetical protein
VSGCLRLHASHRQVVRVLAVYGKLTEGGIVKDDGVVRAGLSLSPAGAQQAVALKNCSRIANASHGPAPNQTCVTTLNKALCLRAWSPTPHIGVVCRWIADYPDRRPG